MFKRSQRPVETKAVPPKPVVEPAPIFTPEWECDATLTCHEKAAYHHSWIAGGNVGRVHKFYCPKCWAARQERLKKAGG